MNFRLALCWDRDDPTRARAETDNGRHEDGSLRAAISTTTAAPDELEQRFRVPLVSGDGTVP